MEGSKLAQSFLTEELLKDKKISFIILNELPIRLNENTTATGTLLQSQNCLLTEEDLKIQIPLYFNMSKFCLLTFVSTLETILIVEDQGVYYLLDSHPRTQELVLSDKDQSRAILIAYSKPGSLSRLIEVIIKLFKRKSSKRAIVKCTPLRIELQSTPLYISQQSLVSPGAAVISRFNPELGFNIGIGLSHQWQVKYGATAGLQCTAMSAVACAYSLLRPPHIWSAMDLEEILSRGNVFYSLCANRAGRFGQYLAADEIHGTVVFSSGDSYSLHPLPYPLPQMLF